MKALHIAAAVSAAAALTACMGSAPPTAAQQAAKQQEVVSERAQQEVGIFTPTRFTRKRFANLIGQMLDDPTLATVSYAQGLDGKLRCIGHTIGFPMPGGTQTTSPMKWEERPTPGGFSRTAVMEQVPQSEPDQLYYPSSSSGTFLMLVSKKGVAKPVYFEGNVEAFPADDKPDPSLIAQDCTT